MLNLPSYSIIINLKGGDSGNKETIILIKIASIIFLAIYLHIINLTNNYVWYISLDYFVLSPIITIPIFELVDFTIYIAHVHIYFDFYIPRCCTCFCLVSCFILFIHFFVTLCFTVFNHFYHCLFL